MRLRRRPRPDIHDTDPARRRAAIDTAGVGHNVLRRVVTTDPDHTVRCAAVRRLHDLVILRCVLEHDGDESVRESARVRYRQLLAGGDTLDINYRCAALEACADHQIIAHVARSAREPCLRRAAIGRIHEPRLLDEIRQHDADATVRAAAGARLAVETQRFER
mgnify:CR=1 FL=1